jgi:ribosomal protein S18 acetylase RimI-like enzyme
MNYITIDSKTGEHPDYSNDQIAEFLWNSLDQFGDKKEFILKAIEYSLNPEKGGFVLLGLQDNDIIGAVVINKTGMDGYIPSNILVYIAVNEKYRGQGIGKKLMLEAMSKTTGGVALHVEPNNPAKFLYENLGFTNKYLEMRYQPANS